MTKREIYVNKVILEFLWIVCGMMVVTAWLEGTKQLIFPVLVTLLTLILGGLGFLVYKRNPTWYLLRYFFCCYFGIVYCVYLFFTAYKQMVIIGLIANICIILYHDNKYSIFTAIAMILANVGVFGIRLSMNKVTGVEVSVYIGLIVFFLACWLIIIAIQSKFSKADEELIEKQKIEQKEQLENLQRSSQSMSNIILELSSKVEDVKKDMLGSKDAVKGIAEATNETALNIQNQTTVSIKIQSIIDELRNVIASIGGGISDSVSVTKAGHSMVEQLSQKTDQIVVDNEQVVELMKNLGSEVEQIRGITDTINKITNSTNLLALNASIEAARVGEQGKGFAVVANEIRQLAESTKESTHQIENMLGHFIQSIVDVQNIVTITSQNVTDESILMKNVNQQFEAIDEKLTHTQSLSLELEKKSEYLWSCNEDYVDQINNLSATSEEVSAQSICTTQTLDTNYNNLIDSLDELQQLVQLVNQL